MSLTQPADANVRPDATGTSAPEVLWLEAAGVDLGATPVLRDMDLRVRTGEVVGLVGPNGAGKSTLLRVLATLLPLSRGAGTVLGADLASSDRVRVRARIVLLGHEPGLHPSLTLRENFELIAALRGPAGRDPLRVLGAVGLAAASDRLLRRCSRGMVRRAEIARALAVAPHLLLLDEAHAGLDPEACGLVAALVADVRRRGGSAVVVSHDLDRLVGLVDRVVVLEAGRVAS